MAIRLQIEYGGQILTEVEVPLTDAGHLVRAMISALTPALQVAHVWKPGQPGQAGHGQGTVNSEVDQTLRVILLADTAGELDLTDFIQLRTAFALWLFIEGADTGLTIAQAEFELPHTGVFIGQAELELPGIGALFVAQAEFEMPQSGLFVGLAEFEVPYTGYLMSETVEQDPLLGEDNIPLDEET